MIYSISKLTYFKSNVTNQMLNKVVIMARSGTSLGNLLSRYRFFYSYPNKKNAYMPVC